MSGLLASALRFDLTGYTCRYAAAFLILCLMVPNSGYARAQSPSVSRANAESAPGPGQSDYMANCAGCHGETLGGGFGPPLRGSGFRSEWLAVSPDALAKTIADTMPPAKPNGLPEATYQRIAAFIRSANGLSGAASSAGERVPKATSAAASSEYSVGGVGALVANEDAVYRKVLAAHGSELASLRPVDEATLRNPPPGDWLQWRRTDDGNGFSPLCQIDKANVGRLSLAWAKALPPGTNEITPLVHNGVMFIDSSNTIFALDIKTGETLWRYFHPEEITMFGPPVSQPRSLAIFEDRLYVPTLDNHIIALNIHSGAVLWDRLVQKTDGSLRMSAGPIVVHGKVIQGTAGCFIVTSSRGCFIVALDARTGSELWRFYTIPLNREPGADTWNGAPVDERSGAGVWTAGTYDPSTNLVYFGTGQTYHIGSLMLPDGKVTRANSGLYTDTTLALNPDTGKLVWYYQHMARDVWDLDWSFERLLFDIQYKGTRRRVVATMGKLGILDVLDARSGKYLFSYDVGMQNLVKRIDPRTGRKVTDLEMEPRPDRAVHLCPFAIGVRNWPATSYDPTRGLLYVPLGDSCMELAWNKGAKLDITYGPRPHTDARGNNGRFTAIAVAGRREQWTTRYRSTVISAALATAGGIVFEGGRDRQFQALDSDTGKLLWRMHLDNIPSGSAISFSDDGTQYVSITTGGGNPDDATRASETPEVEPAAEGTTLWVFKLP